MGGAVKTLTLELTGKNLSLNRMFSDSGQQVSAFQKKVEGSNRSLSAGSLAAKGAAAGAVALAAGLAYAVSKAVAFDKAMRNVNSLTKMNETQFKAMEKQVISMSTKLPQSATTLAEGLYDIASSGFQGADGLKVLDAAARSASAGLTSTATSSKAITAVLNAYGLGAKDAADVSDVLFSTVNLGVLSFDELANNLGDVVGATAAAKVGIDEVGAAIATMTLSGIKGAQSTTALSSLTTKLVQPSTALADLYKRLGYESGAAALEGKGLHGVMEDIRKATGGNITTMLQLFPDIEAARGALALMANDGANYAKVSDQITDKTKRMGATQAVLDEQMKSVSAQWQLFTNKIDAAAITVGVKLLPALSQGMALTQNFGAAVGKMAMEIKDRAGSGIGDFGDSLDSVIQLLQGLGEAALSVAVPLGKLGGGAIIETFNLLADVLSKVTGLAADNQGAVLALGLAYAVHAVGGIGAMTSGMGMVSDLMRGKFTPGMYNAAEGVLSLGDKAKAAGAKIMAMAPALAVGGALAIAITAWSSYSKAADRAGDITKGTQAVMSSFKVDDLAGELKKAQGFIDEFNTRLDDIGTSNSLGGAMADFLNVGKNFETLGMQDNLEKVQAAANDTAQRIGQLQYNTVELFKIMGKPLPNEAKWINDVQGANGAKAQADAMAQMNGLLDTLGPKLKAAGVDMGAAWNTQQMTNASSALQQITSGTDQTAAAQASLVEAMGGAASAMGDASKSADTLKQSLDSLMGASLGVAQADIAWMDGLADLGKTLKENKGDLNLNSQAGRDNQSAIIGQVERLQDQLVATANAGAGQAELTGKLMTGREALIKAGEAAKIPRGEMVKLLAQYKLTPELVQTLITQSGAAGTKEAMAKVIAEAKALDKQKPKPKVSAETTVAQSRLNAVQNRLDALDGRNATSTVTVNTVANTYRNLIETKKTDTGVRLPQADGGYYPGGLMSYADGKLPGQATIKSAKSGGWVQWGEPETQGEAYIPMAKSKRSRSEQILGTVADKFGLALVEKYAKGGFRYPAFKFSYEAFKPGSTATAAERNTAYQTYLADRRKARADQYRTWLDNRYQAFEAFKDTARLYATMQGRSAAGRTQVTRSASDTLTAVGTSAENREQARAELVAQQSKNTADDASDFYKKPVIALKAYTDALRGSVAAQQQWGVDMRKVSSAVGPDVVASLQAMGDEGEAIIKKMAKSSVAEMKAMADQVRKIDFANFTNQSIQDLKGQQQFQANLATLVKMGRADLAQKFSDMGFESAGGLAAQAVNMSATSLAGLANTLNSSDALNDPAAKEALSLASTLQTAGRRLGIIGLSQFTGKPIGDVMGLLSKYDASIFKNLSPYVMSYIRGDQALLKAGKQPSGLAMGSIVRGSDTGYYWGEPSSGGESLIPHGIDRRARALELWKATGRILGATSADGGGGRSGTVISPGAVTVSLTVPGANLSPAQVEAAAQRATTSAFNELVRQLEGSRR